MIDQIVSDHYLVYRSEWFASLSFECFWFVDILNAVLCFAFVLCLLLEYQKKGLVSYEAEGGMHAGRSITWPA